MPFKLNQDRRHHIPRQTHKVTNWPAYEAGLRRRGSLTVWFSDEAIEAWAAEPCATRGGQPWYSALAILTALTLRAVFRLAFRQTEGLIGSIVDLLGLALRVPDHTTLSRRSATLEVPRPSRPSTGAWGRAHALAGGQHGVEAVRARRVAGREARHPHASVVEEATPGHRRRHRADRGRLAHGQGGGRRRRGRRLARPGRGTVATFIADGGYDQDSVSTAVAERHPEAAIIVPPRTAAVPSDDGRDARRRSATATSSTSPSTAARGGRKRPATRGELWPRQGSGAGSR